MALICQDEAGRGKERQGVKKIKVRTKRRDDPIRWKEKKNFKKKFVHLVRDILYRHIKLTIIIYFFVGDP